MSIPTSQQDIFDLANRHHAEITYGPFPGGDPRHYYPDHEVCTPQEISNWQAAAEAWEKGEGRGRDKDLLTCLTIGDGSYRFGLGTSAWIEGD